MSSKGEDESRDGVPLSNLDQALFDRPGATKRDLVDVQTNCMCSGKRRARAQRQ